MAIEDRKRKTRTSSTIADRADKDLTSMVTSARRDLLSAASAGATNLSKK